MMQRLNQNNIMNMFNMLKNANNPQAMIKQLMMNNPNVKSAVDYINANGGNAQDAFYKLANEKGVNPEDILSQFK